MRVGSWQYVVFLGAIWASLAASSNTSAGDSSRLPKGKPEDVAMSSFHLQRIDQVVAEGLRIGRMPGCVVAIGRHGRIVFEKAYGNRAVLPDVEPMTVDTIFDLASITKPVATATSVMLLIERGELRLGDKISYYNSEFSQNGKRDVTVFQLLTHQGGFIPDNADADYLQGPEIAMQKIFALTPTSPPGTKFIYSDVGFIVLGDLVKRISGKSVHDFSNENIFRPLGMKETSYLPAKELHSRIAPTEKRRGAWMRGQVHDPRADYLGGVAGHAGLFSSAQDLAIYAEMLLNGGIYNGVRIMSPRTVSVMTANYASGVAQRGLGWDKLSAYSTNRGELLSNSAYGHSGFTGTSLWIDPELDLFVIVLSNRVHPDGKGLINPLSGRIGTIAATAVLDVSSLPDERPMPRVLPAQDGTAPEGATSAIPQTIVRQPKT